MASQSNSFGIAAILLDLFARAPSGRLDDWLQKYDPYRKIMNSFG
jgi:hypothetical protein